MAFPIKMLEEMDAIAKAEHRTRSDFIREAVRRYMQGVQTRRSFSVHATAAHAPTEEQYVFEEGQI